MSIKDMIFGSTEPTLSEIENAFQPAKEITDADRFAGRRNSVIDSYYALLANGANLAIVGNRGIGKTSLAKQIMNIGGGDLSLLRKFDQTVAHKPDFLPLYYACGNTTRNTDDLLTKLLTLHSCLADWVYDTPKARKILYSLSPKLGAKIGIKPLELSAELGGNLATEDQSAPPELDHHLDVVFTNIANAIAEEGVTRDGLLMVVDEFDQISDPKGFASFLKSLATNAPKVRFCIVGVAKDLQNLIKEHESSDRLFAGGIIALPSMSTIELKEIITIAEQKIANFIEFDEAAKEKLARLAQGHPYMVHLVGKYALRAAYQQNRKIISPTDISATLKAIAERGADPVLEGKYRKAVASSPQRETVLRALAENQDAQGEIWTTNAYKVALDQGVENASQYVGQLVTEQYGAELENVRERYYRFKDSLFSTYICARPRLMKPDLTSGLGDTPGLLQP